MYLLSPEKECNLYKDSGLLTIFATFSRLMHSMTYEHGSKYRFDGELNVVDSPTVNTKVSLLQMHAGLVKDTQYTKEHPSRLYFSVINIQFKA